MIYILLAILSGFSVVISRILNAKLSLKIGLYQSTLFNYITGFALSVTLLAVMSGNIGFNPGVPSYAFFGGIIGVLVVVLQSYVTHRVSNYDITLLTFIGQLSTGVIIDLFLGNTIPTTKMIGGVIIFVGLLYNIWVDGQDRKKDSLPI